MTHTLEPQPLSRETFAPYGDVIDTNGAQHFAINAGFAERYHDLAKVDVTGASGRPLISIFRGKPRTLPMAINLMERHPLGSQAFFPLSSHPFLIVVGSGEDECPPATLRAFISKPGQGVNYARNVWHHPLIALHAECDFLIVDRGGPGDNLQEIHYPDGLINLSL